MKGFARRCEPRVLKNIFLPLKKGSIYNILKKTVYLYAEILFNKILA